MEGGLSSLGIEPAILLAQVINFIILFSLLYFVAYKPIMRMFDERSKKIKESMDQTEQIKEQAEHAEKETAKQIKEARQEGQKIIQKAEKIGDEIRQKAQLDAEKQSEKILKRAQIEIKHERDEAISELKQQFANLTIITAGKVIDKTLDEETHREIINKALEESSDLN